jgi:hypothetical protein
VRVFVASGKGPAGIQLRTSTGAFLCAAIIGKDGNVGYDHTGSATPSSTVFSTVTYAAGTWLDVRIDWFDDHTFDAYLGGTKFADRVAFATGVDPGRVMLTAGDSGTTAAQAYFDTVQVTRLQLADGFDGYATGGPPPSPWTVSTPAGATVRVYDASMVPSVPPANGTRAIEMTDTGKLRAELSRAFAATPEGSVTYKARIQSAAAAPLDLQIWSANDTYLFTVRMQSDDGRIAYNNSAGGTGPFTRTNAAWMTGIWQSIRIDWFADDTFDGYIGASQFASRRPFGTFGDPGKLKFVTDTTSSDTVYLDSVAVSQQPVESVRGRYTENATWLSHGFTSASKYVLKVSDMLRRMKDMYRVKYLYVNVGRVDKDGYFQSTNDLTYLVALLTAIETFETTYGYKFHVVAMVNGNTLPTANDPLKQHVIDLSSSDVRAHIAQECARFVSALASDSHVTGATRVFDGCQLDIEPSGGTYFADVKQLVQDTRARDEMAGKSLGFTASKLQQPDDVGNPWRWDPQYFYEMASLVEQLQVTTYNSSTTASEGGEAYSKWIKDQTIGVLKAVSGEAWGNDASHPALANRPKVFIGFPAMGGYDSMHVAGVETVQFAAIGVDQGLTELINTSSPSLRFFAGSATWVQGDGSGDTCIVTDAGEDCETADPTDWWWHGRYWLGSW